MDGEEEELGIDTLTILMAAALVAMLCASSGCSARDGGPERHPIEDLAGIERVVGGQT